MPSMFRRDKIIQSAALFVTLLSTGCAGLVLNEGKAMKAELYNQRARINHMAELDTEIYDVHDDASNCPPAKSPLRNQCFFVNVIGHPSVYLIQTNDTAAEQIIAIRGTANLNDAFTDLETAKTPDDKLGVNDHTGFRNVARAILADIQNNHRLKPAYKTIATGHSLGGAVALLVGLYLYADDKTEYQVQGVYTFGQPKVFDNEGTTAWPFFSRRVYRIVDCDDVVAIVPTSSNKLESLVSIRLFDSERLDNYQHMGQSVLLMDNGLFWMPGSIEYERDLSHNVADSLLDLWKHQQFDHSMAQYNIRLSRVPNDVAMMRPTPPSRTSFQCTRIAPGTIVSAGLR